MTRLCLEPYGLREGVVSTGAAAVTTTAATAATASGATAWYVDMQGQQKAPLLAGHTASVTALVPAPAADATPSATDHSTSHPIAADTDSSLVASLGQDGRLAIWQTAAASSTGGSGSSRSVVSQVPLVEWLCPDSPATAAAFLPRSPACVLGHADGRISLLEFNSEHSGLQDWGSGGGGDTARNAGQGGVLRWCVLRHPSAVIALALHPNQPLVMAASRWVAVHELWGRRIVPHWSQSKHNWHMDVGQGMGNNAVCCLSVKNGRVANMHTCILLQGLGVVAVLTRRIRVACRQHLLTHC